MQGSQTTASSSVARKRLLFFSSHFLVSNSAPSSLPVSIFCCTLWFHLAKPLPRFWLPWTRSACFHYWAWRSLGMEVCVTIIFCVRLVIVNGPGVSFWYCQVKTNQATRNSCTVSYHTFWLITYMRQIMPIFSHKICGEKMNRKRTQLESRIFSLISRADKPKHPVFWSWTLQFSDWTGNVAAEESREKSSQNFYSELATHAAKSLLQW